MRVMATVFALIFTMSVTANAETNTARGDLKCYDLHPADSGGANSVDQICVVGRYSDIPTMTVILRTRAGSGYNPVASFQMKLVEENECEFQNTDVYSFTGANSDRSGLKIVFFGSIDAGTGEESGIVDIFGGRFHYDFLLK